MNDQFDLILEDLDKKPLFIIGGRGSGKTEIAKYLLFLAKQKWGTEVDIRCFDSSLAWFHDSPLDNRMRVGPLMIRIGLNRDDTATLYEIGQLDEDNTKSFLQGMIGYWYSGRYSGFRANPDYLDGLPLSLPCFEEAQSILKKRGLPKVVFDWVSQGRNFKMSALFCTHRGAEIATEIIERCNLLVGYTEGDNNKRKIRGATSKDFMKLVSAIEPESYEFCYYNGKQYSGIKGEYLNYGTPVDISNFVSSPKNWISKLKNKISMKTALTIIAVYVIFCVLFG